MTSPFGVGVRLTISNEIHAEIECQRQYLQVTRSYQLVQETGPTFGSVYEFVWPAYLQKVARSTIWPHKLMRRHKDNVTAKAGGNLFD